MFDRNTVKHQIDFCEIMLKLVGSLGWFFLQLTRKSRLLRKDCIYLCLLCLFCGHQPIILLLSERNEKRFAIFGKWEIYVRRLTDYHKTKEGKSFKAIIRHQEVWISHHLLKPIDKMTPSTPKKILSISFSDWEYYYEVYLFPKLFLFQKPFLNSCICSHYTLTAHPMRSDTAQAKCQHKPIFLMCQNYVGEEGTEDAWMTVLTLKLLSRITNMML